MTFNQAVRGSIPLRPTSHSKGLEPFNAILDGYNPTLTTLIMPRNLLFNSNKTLINLPLIISYSLFV